MSDRNVGFVTKTEDDISVKSRGIVSNGDLQKQQPFPFFGKASAGADSSSTAPAVPFMQPCSLSGLSSALSSGTVGYIFGVLPTLVFNFKNIKLSDWRKYNADGMASAKSFAGMTGLYTFFHCLAVRLRQTDDGINRLIAGGVSGLILGWSGGIWGAVQNALIVGALSYFFDGSKSTSSAKASPCSGGICIVRHRRLRHGGGEGEGDHHAVDHEEDGDEAYEGDRAWRRRVSSLVKLSHASALNHLRHAQPQPALAAVALVFNQGYFDVYNSTLGAQVPRSTRARKTMAASA